MLPINYAQIVEEIHKSFRAQCTSENCEENIFIEPIKEKRESFWRKLFKKKEEIGEPIGEPNCKTIYPK